MHRDANAPRRCMFGPRTWLVSSPQCAGIAHVHLLQQRRQIFDRQNILVDDDFTTAKPQPFIN